MILGNEFQNEIECGINEYKKTVKSLNKTVYMYTHCFGIED